MEREPAAEREFLYDAFISYRHVQPDRKWAKWLHRSLETFRTPKALVAEGAPARLEKVFLDELELSASSDLAEEIDEALEQSRFLIVVCSPRTPESKWVNQEIVRFRETERADQVLALLVEGEPAEAFPPALLEVRHAVSDERGWKRQELESVEPLAADVRTPYPEGGRYRKRMALLRLLAPLLGCDLDDLNQRDRQRRRKRAAALSIAAVVLIGVLTGLTLWALSSRSEALRQEQIARREAGLSFREQGRRALMEGSAPQALVYLSHALDRIPDDMITRFLIAQGIRRLTVHTLGGHDDFVISATFSPDGTRVVTASSDKTARIFDATTGRLLSTLARHEGTVFSAAFSPDGTRIVTASEDGTARVFDAVTGEEVAALMGHHDSVKWATFSPDGKRVVTASLDRTARIFGATTGDTLAVLKGHQDWVHSAVFSPDGTRVVTASFDNTARIFDAATGETLQVLEGHTLGLNSVAFSPDGTRVVTASEDNTARVFDSATGKTVATLKGHQSRVHSAAFSPDGKHVVTAGQDHTARVFDAAHGHEVRALRGHRETVRTAVYSPDGARILTASRDNTARLYDAATGKTVAILEGHKDQVISAAFNSDGTRVVTVSYDGTSRIFNALPAGRVVPATIALRGKRVLKTADFRNSLDRVCDAATGDVIATLEGQGESGTWVVFSPDWTRVAVARSVETKTGNVIRKDWKARVFDADSGRALSAPEGHEGGVVSAAFSPDGRRLVTGGDDRTARIFDSFTGEQLVPPMEHDKPVSSVAYSHDGTLILTVADGVARIFDASTGDALATLEGRVRWASSTAFSSDMTRIVMASDDNWNRAVIFDVETGKALATLEGHTSAVASAAFSEDGLRVVTASWDKTARIFDAATGKALGMLAGHTGFLDSAAFNSDGTRVVTMSFLSGAADGTSRIWDVAPDLRSIEEIAKEIRARVPYQLSEQGVVVPRALPEASK
jgi:WD40 repeat protein